MSDKRSRALDIAKGIGIILVFIGHIGFSEEIVKLIYSFHMPLFFVCSGYLYKTEYDKISIREFIRKKAKSLMYPYFVLGTVIIVYNSLVDVFLKRFVLIQLGKRVIALLYGAYIWENNYEYIGTLWFLPALFCAQIVFYAINRIIKNMRFRAVIIVLITAFGFLLSNIIIRVNKTYDLPFNVRLPFCFDTALTAVVFVFLGYAIKSFTFSRQINFTLGVGLLAAGLFLPLFNKRVDILYLQFGNYFLYIFSAALSCTGVIMLCKWVSVFEVKFSPFEYLGKKSLLLMVVHLYVLSYVHRVLALIDFDNPISELFLTLAVSILMAEIIERKLKWLYRYNKNSVKVEKNE